MLNMIYELNEEFEKNVKVRMAVYLAAVMLTILNFRILINMPHDGRRMLMLIVTALPTALIYYISGGIAGCYIVVKAGAKIINVILFLVVLFCPFAASLLMIFSTVISMMACAYFAYALPILFVPAVGLIRRRLCTADKVEA